MSQKNYSFITPVRGEQLISFRLDAEGMQFECVVDLPAIMDGQNGFYPLGGWLELREETVGVTGHVKLAKFDSPTSKLQLKVLEYRENDTIARVELKSPVVNLQPFSLGV